MILIYDVCVLSTCLLDSFLFFNDLKHIFDFSLLTFTVIDHRDSVIETETQLKAEGSREDPLQKCFKTNKYSALNNNLGLKGFFNIILEIISSFLYK